MTVAISQSHWTQALSREEKATPDTLELAEAVQGIDTFAKEGVLLLDGLLEVHLQWEVWEGLLAQTELLAGFGSVDYTPIMPAAWQSIDWLKC